MWRVALSCVSMYMCMCLCVNACATKSEVHLSACLSVFSTGCVVLCYSGSWFCISLSNVLLPVIGSQNADTSLPPRHLKTVSICHQIDILMCSSPAKVLIGCLAQWSVKVIHTVNANGLCTYLEATVLHGYWEEEGFIASLQQSPRILLMCCEGIHTEVHHSCTMDLAGMV